MSDPAMWSRAKQVATYIVRDWMLLDADERTMDKLVEEIELELDRSFDAGMRAASHGAPLVRAVALEEAAEVLDAEADAYRKTGLVPELVSAVERLAAAIRALNK